MSAARCPHCGRFIEVADEHAGRVMVCPVCGGAFLAPGAPAAESLPDHARRGPPDFDFRNEPSPRRRGRRRRDDDDDDDERPGVNFSYLNCALLSLAIIFGIQAIVLVLFCTGVFTVFLR